MFGLYKLVFLIAVLLLMEVSSGEGCNKRCAVCDAGRCLECRYGWYGHNCNSKCQNCWITGCKKHSGICDQCTPGKYGEDCGASCPENCRRDNRDAVYCRRGDGKCLDGCQKGWWGKTCSRKCSEHCKSGFCLQDNGHCISDCKEGWWGGSCDKKCSDGCLHNMCYGFSGKCKHGCENGYTSHSCDEKCDKGCSICHQITRICEKWSPNRCGRQCTECSQRCKNSACDITGICVEGCIRGFMGDVCDKPCPANCLTCEQDGKVCSKCDKGWTGELCNIGTEAVVTTPHINIKDLGNSGSEYYLCWTLLTVCVVSSILQHLRCQLVVP